MYVHFFVAAGGSILLVAALGAVWPALHWAWLIIMPAIAVGVYDLLQPHHSLRRNYPLVARFRWLMEALRPYMQQYFIESDVDGRPINRMLRTIVYQRAKGEQDTVPFGTKVEVYEEGYEWLAHSLGALPFEAIERDLRVQVGGPQCRRPYLASIFNVSAMSYGALSPNALRALNRAAQLGKFAHNTGEGGLSPYHLEEGGDLVWQLGTGYFGCRDENGDFSAEKFREKAQIESVKMIEIKLSQGAKPGHGGILPASKNTSEVAAVRGVPVGTTVVSPPTHRAFSSPVGLLHFVARLRELSDGKPVGFKLAVGQRSEFLSICRAMVETGILPDFITVDGGEGGTGAAPLEYANSVGMPLTEALAFVVDALVGFDLKSSIRVVASGKILTGFHVVKNMALGADLCNSARGMMLALGCVQSLMCDTNRCPTGVATQDPRLYRGVVVPEKALRVASFHDKTVHATAELLASAGLRHPAELTRAHIFRRIDQRQIARYDEIFPSLTAGCLRAGEIPQAFARDMAHIRGDRFGAA